MVQLMFNKHFDVIIGKYISIWKKIDITGEQLKALRGYLTEDLEVLNLIVLY